jgi:hypothetical protein
MNDAGQCVFSFLDVDVGIRAMVPLSVKSAQEATAPKCAHFAPRAEFVRLSQLDAQPRTHLRAHSKWSQIAGTTSMALTMGQRQQQRKSGARDGFGITLYRPASA